MTETLANDVLLYLEILVDEICAIDAVCHDTAHESGGKEYIFRLFFIEETAYGNSVQQIELFMGFSYKVGVTLFLQVFPDSRTYQSMMSCNVYFGIFFHD